MLLHLELALLVVSVYVCVFVCAYTCVHVCGRGVSEHLQSVTIGVCPLVSPTLFGRDAAAGVDAAVIQCCSHHLKSEDTLSCFAYVEAVGSW